MAYNKRKKKHLIVGFVTLSGQSYLLESEFILPNDIKLLLKKISGKIKLIYFCELCKIIPQYGHNQSE